MASMATQAIDTSTCGRCGMPLAYDRVISPRSNEAGRDGSLCSFCQDPKNHASGSSDLPEDHSLALRLALKVYAKGGGRWQSLARFASKLPLLTAQVRTLARMLGQIPRKSPDSRYDAVVLFSGGKDSSYMLLELSKLDLRLCAWMLSQGYQSPTAINNARMLCDKIGVPLMIEEPERKKMDNLFRLGFGITNDDTPDMVRAVMTYGSACWPCFATIAARATSFCEENRIPFCFIGTQSGQNRLDVGGRPAFAGVLPKSEDLVSKFVDPLRDRVAQDAPESAGLLARLRCSTLLIPYYEFVPKPEVHRQLEILKDVGWSMPTNTGACSTNCMINELGRHIMRRRFGFDLYQVIEAHERRMGKRGAGPAVGAGGTPAVLDTESILRASRMIKLSAEEIAGFEVPVATPELAKDHT